MFTDLTPNQVLNSNLGQWMMVDKSMVSVDGTECNKAGTSYPAFQYQAVSPHCNFPLQVFLHMWAHLLRIPAPQCEYDSVLVAGRRMRASSCRALA